MEYKDIPKNYHVCMNDDCIMAGTCLHQKALLPLMEKEEILSVINPKICSKDASCKKFRDCKPVLYARGFTNFQKRMYPEQYKHFMALCISHWSRNVYFEYRRGERYLSPSEQQFIINTLKEAGLNENMEFDNYEKRINWYD